MKENKASRILKLLLFLGNKPNSTKKDILEKLQCDERTFFNYLREIREAGFLLKCKSGKYFLDKTNDNVKNFSEIINFSNEEEYLIASAIKSLNINKNKKNKLYKKVNFIYKEETPQSINDRKTKKLKDAAENKNQVIIQGYSNNSQIPQTFQCEVYAFDNELRYCWCYINSIKRNAKLKIEDISRVIISPIKWIYKESHLNIECDILGDYGLKSLKVNIFISGSSVSNLINQYPMTENNINKIEHNLYQLKTFVCRYDTITKFILFNLDDIRQIEPPDLKTYITEWLEETTKTYFKKEHAL